MKRKGSLKWGDILICVLVLVLAGAFALPFYMRGSDTLCAEVWQDQRLVRQIQLKEGTKETFTVAGDDGVYNVVEVDGLRARIAQSDCADQVCVQTGWLTRNGQSAICLPNRLILKLTGEKESEVDAVAQ